MKCFAVKVTDAHCNNQGIMHGGVLVALADNALGLACAVASGKESTTRTVNLAISLLGSVTPGSWLEIVPTVVKTGRSLCFGCVEILSDGVPVGTVQGIFSVRRYSP